MGPNLEIRISNLNKLDEVLRFDCDIIGIGSESCVHKLPLLPDLLTAADKIRENGRKIRLLTPFVPEKYFDKVLNLVKDFSNECKKAEITINDHGLLYAFHSQSPRGTRLGLGHILSFTSEECPWYENIIRDETAEVKNGYIRCNMQSESKVKLYKKLRVLYIESAMFPRASKHFDKIRELDIDIVALYEYAPIAYSRVCPTARFYKKKIPECIPCCDKGITIELEKPLDRRKQSFIDIDMEAEKYLCPLSIVGNAIYRKIENPGKNFAQVETVALESVFYDSFEIKKVIKAIREGI